MNNRRAYAVLWKSPSGERTERVELREGIAGFEARGLIVRRGEGGELKIEYRIGGDSRWRVKSLRLSLAGETEPGLELRADGAGQWWSESGERLRGLEGCLDVEIQASPFTNTVAIRRLRLPPGAVADVIVVFVSVPDLKTRAVRQRYGRSSVVADPTIYTYEGLDSGFTSELPVDSDGLLLEYPGYFTRLWKRSLASEGERGNARS